MIEKINLNNILFLDIETVPEEENFNSLDAEMQSLWDLKTQYQRKDEFSPEEFYERAGIWAEFGKIICISVGFFTIKGDVRNFRVTSFFGEEKKILKDFSNLVNNHFNQPQHLLCGHNSKEFDIPFIARRMIINQMPIPEKLNLFGKKPWEIPHLDTLEMWKFGDKKHYTSLELLSEILHIPTSKNELSGDMVNTAFYKEQDLDKIARYCREDVVVLAQLYLRYQHLELVQEDNIERI